MEYQKYTACIKDWQRKETAGDGITKGLQELSLSESHGSHMTQQPLLPSMSHDSHVIQEDSTTILHESESQHPSIMPRPQQLITMATDEPLSISPGSTSNIGIPGNHDNIMEPDEVATAREEVATLVAEKHRLEAQHKRLERLLQETRARMVETKEVRVTTLALKARHLATGI